MPTMRCSMPSRAQPGLDRDLAIGTTIRDANGNNLGVYATITHARDGAGGRYGARRCATGAAPA